MHEHFFEAIAHAPPSRRSLADVLRSSVLRPRSSPHTVLGVRLLPLSIWHELLLEAIDSPFAHGATETQVKYRQSPNDRELKFRALFQAAEVCRLLPPDLPEHESAGAHRRRRRAFRRFYRRSNLADLVREEVALLHYLADYRPAPISKSASSKDEKVTSPYWLYQIAVFERFHPETVATIGPSSAWAMSPGEIAWRNAAAFEAHGVPVRIATEALLRSLERARKREAKKNGAAKPNGNVSAQNPQSEIRNPKS